MATPLSRYLTTNKVSHSELARRVGVQDSYIWRLAHGHRARPSLRVALDIERETEGVVKAQSWPHLRPVLRALERREGEAA